MANTFTTNYNLTKSEIGGDNQNWGTNIHETITEVDAQLVNKLDHGIVKGFSSGVISFTTGTNGTIASASGDLFEDFKAADKVRISGSSNAANNGVHTIVSKSSANAIVVSSALATVAAGSTITVELVLEAGYIDAGPTTVDSLTVEGHTTLGNDVDADETTFASKVKSDILPKTDGTYDLGGAGAEWQDLHIDGTANIDGLVADGTYALSGSGTIAGCSALTTTATTITMSGYSIGTNGKGDRTQTTGTPSGGSDGDIHYEYA